MFREKAILYIHYFRNEKNKFKFKKKKNLLLPYIIKTIQKYQPFTYLYIYGLHWTYNFKLLSDPSILHVALHFYFLFFEQVNITSYMWRFRRHKKCYARTSVTYLQYTSYVCIVHTLYGLVCVACLYFYVWSSQDYST